MSSRLAVPRLAGGLRWVLFDRTILSEKPSGASGGWEQDKKHQRATKPGEFGEIQPTVEPDSKRESDWIPMVRAMFGDRVINYQADDTLLDSIQGLKVLG